jgi:hypothetical protein
VSNFEVPNPILSSPFEEPKEHWWILEGQPAERRQGRRPALYFYRDPKRETDERGGLAIEMKLVNRIREQVPAPTAARWLGVFICSQVHLIHPLAAKMPLWLRPPRSPVALISENIPRTARPRSPGAVLRVRTTVTPPRPNT